MTLNAAKDFRLAHPISDRPAPAYDYGRLFARAGAGTPVKLPCGCDDYGTGCQSPALHA